MSLSLPGWRLLGIQNSTEWKVKDPIFVWKIARVEGPKSLQFGEF
jgi:hypothetical protein